MLSAKQSGPALLAEFESATSVAHAARRLRALGYESLEVYSPFPLSEAEQALGLQYRRIPLIVLVAGLTGAAIAILIQWFTNAWNYPINVGGRPLFALPAWVPITFETGVLAGAFGAFFGLWFEIGFPRLWDPVFEVDVFDGATADRFWLAVGTDDARFDADRTRRELDDLGALRVAAVGEAV